MECRDPHGYTRHQRPIQPSHQDIEILPSEVNEVLSVVNLIIEPETREKVEADQPEVYLIAPNKRLMRKWRGPSWGDTKAEPFPQET